MIKIRGEAIILKMPSLRPVVFEPVGLIDFIQYILDHHAPSTLVVCCSKDVFLKQLHNAVAIKTSTPQDEGAESYQPMSEATAVQGLAHPNRTLANLWTIPSLRLLASSRTVKLVFCPEVTHLRAYLATYTHRKPDGSEHETLSHPGETSSVPILAALNLVNLHRTTSAFSAQGLNRTLASAVEAAYKTNSRLVLAECPVEHVENPPSDDLEMGNGEPSPDVTPIGNVWEEEISILNVTTKTFGAGERGWVGRTVKIRTIAERWCEFRTLDGGEV